MTQYTIKDGKLVTNETPERVVSTAEQLLNGGKKNVVKEIEGVAESAARAFVSSLAVSFPTLAANTRWADLKVAGAAVLVSAATAGVYAGIKFIQQQFGANNA